MRAWQWAALLGGLGAALMAQAEWSLAWAQGEGDPFASGRSRMCDVTRGVEMIAYPSAVIAVIVIGFLAWKGQFPWGRMMVVCFSIFLIGMSASMVRYFADGAEGCEYSSGAPIAIPNQGQPSGYGPLQVLSPPPFAPFVQRFTCRAWTLFDSETASRLREEQGVLPDGSIGDPLNTFGRATIYQVPVTTQEECRRFIEWHLCDTSNGDATFGVHRQEGHYCSKVSRPVAIWSPNAPIKCRVANGWDFAVRPQHFTGRVELLSCARR